MIGKLATGMARRGILKGALGLGAAVGLGAGGAEGRGARSWLLTGARGAAPLEGGSQAEAEPPAWLDAMAQAAQAKDEENHMVARFDGLDLEFAMLRSPSPSWKLVMQRRRDRERTLAARSLWDRWLDMQKKWRKGLLA